MNVLCLQATLGLVDCGMRSCSFEAGQGCAPLCRYGPSSAVGLVVIILIVLLLMGRL